MLIQVLEILWEVLLQKLSWNEEKKLIAIKEEI